MAQGVLDSLPLGLCVNSVHRRQVWDVPQFADTLGNRTRQ
jgi:hypothetical protein